MRCFVCNAVTAPVDIEILHRGLDVIFVDAKACWTCAERMSHAIKEVKARFDAEERERLHPSPTLDRT